MRTTLNIEDDLIDKVGPHRQRKRQETCATGRDAESVAGDTKKKRGIIGDGSCGYIGLGFTFE